MRPWALNISLATAEVMHLAELSAPMETVVARLEAQTPAQPTAPLEPVSARLEAQTPAPHSAAPAPQCSHAASWDWYVRGNIISKHAQRYIVNLLNACCIQDRRANEEAEEDSDSAVSEE